MKRIATCIVVLLLGHAAPSQAQSTLGASIGAWMTSGNTWPRVAVNADHAFGAFVARAEVWAVSRPVSLCSGGASVPECDQHHLMRGVSLGGRLIDQKGAWHPFAGAGAGAERDFVNGLQLYVEAGLRYDIRARWGAELRGSAEWLAENSEVHGGDSVNVGLWYSLGS